MESLYPLTFCPNLHELVWGGHKLQTLKNLPSDGRRLGESWEISDVPTSESVVADGALAGKTLRELVALYGPALLGNHVFEADGREFPLLVKFIDAQDDLSIQVHPNDALAKERHGKLGKTEMWYVMDAEPGATLLAGFKQKVSRKEYRRRVADGTIVDALARHEVHPGDVFFIPAGRVHAICSGILLCEIQQSSDVTYRLFDYHRLGLDGQPRQLHTAEALDAIDFNLYANYRTNYTPVSEGAALIAKCKYFTVNVLTTSTKQQRALLDKDSFVTLSCLSGSGELCTKGGNRIALRRGMSCLIPAVEADFEVTATDGSELKLLEAYVDIK